ncbi:hypothetical protein K458DRAFT_75041 [Lentithecium fluviatile CBS 122367]|uniref:Uncharacterized protein n=1 Tax=Lentithecium fluviatile CBS 122367 TaxID=1168545 RepID=A0A6G1IUU6_9PLEO|nr:hypothetical protein K458DRAFT_75041 [Lentithecium fluviatile CBS 122367]
MNRTTHPMDPSPASTMPGDHPKAEANCTGSATYATASTPSTLSTASTLLDWPLDVLLVLLEYCPRSTLAALARTCKGMHQHSIPRLYWVLDLTWRNFVDMETGFLYSPTQEERDELDRIPKRQKATLAFLLDQPNVASHIKRFMFSTWGHNDAHIVCAIYQVLTLLENVEEVEIRFGSWPASAVVEMQPSDKLLPNVKSMRLGGSIKFVFAEKILLSCERPFLQIVDLSGLGPCDTPEEIQTTGNWRDRFHAGLVYLHNMVSSRAPAVKSIVHIVDPERHIAQPPESTRNDMILQELRQCWLANFKN